MKWLNTIWGEDEARLGDIVVVGHQPDVGIRFGLEFCDISQQSLVERHDEGRPETEMSDLGGVWHKGRY